jgi:ribosomal protein S18 acetylase RimI-like enzyme
MTSPVSLCRVASTIAPSDDGELDIDGTQRKPLETLLMEIIADVKPFSDLVRNDTRLSFLVEQVKVIGQQAFWGNNCIVDCSKRNGWRLNIVTQPPNIGDEVFAFVVYKVDSKQRLLQIQYIAVAEKYRRHGIGSKLIKSLQKYATKTLTRMTVERIACACVPEAVEFYQKHNFRKCKKITVLPGEEQVVNDDGTVEKQIPLQFQMEWKVPAVPRR